MNPLLKQLNQELEAGIKSVLNGFESFETDLPITPRMVINLAKKLKLKQSGDFDTNGWQYDWWLRYTKNGKNYTAFGCGHDGGFEFNLDED